MNKGLEGGKNKLFRTWTQLSCNSFASKVLTSVSQTTRKTTYCRLKANMMKSLQMKNLEKAHYYMYAHPFCIRRYRVK